MPTRSQSLSNSGARGPIVRTMFSPLPEAAGLARAELERLLQWHVEMGVDVAIGEAPRDRFADSLEEIARRQAMRAERESALAPPNAAPPKAARPPLTGHDPPSRLPLAPAPMMAPTTTPVAALLAQEEAAQSARAAAAGARTLKQLRAALEAFDGCGLKRTASQLVFDDGNPQIKIMFIGDPPGADEDRQGVPFAGRPGQLLDRMLASIGLERAQVYLANIVPWRPPGNRDPSPQEMAICQPFIRRQIALVNPDILVTLGAAAPQTLFGMKEAIARVRGTWFDFEIEGDEGPRIIKALASLHPAYLLRTSRAKREAWKDLRALKKALDGQI